MRKKKRAILLTFASLIAALLLLAGLLLFTARTAMFRQEIRSRIVAALERASGGHVDLQSFDFDWHTLTAQLNQLVIHGSEPPDGPPLLTVASLRIQFRITSLLRRKIDLSSVTAARPKAYLLLRPDGTTNLPAPHLDPQTALAQLFDLQIKHFLLEHGALLVNHRQYPLDLQAQNMHALAVYVKGQNAYRLSLASNPLLVASPCCRPFPLSLDASATLRQNSLDVQSLNLASNSSRLQGQGTLRHFNRPESDLHFHSEVAAPEAASVMRLAVLPAGSITLDGVAHFDMDNGLSVEGGLRARHLSYRLPRFDARNVDLTSQFHFAKHAYALNNVVAQLLGGRFTGAASLDPSRAFRLNGRLSAVDIRQLARALKSEPIPYSGSASGPLVIGTNLDPSLKQFSLRTSLTIAPRSGAIPLSGTVTVAQNGSSGFEFTDSQLAVPDARLSFHGTYGKVIAAQFDSTSLGQLSPAWKLLKLSPANLPVLLPGGSAHFSGSLEGTFARPSLAGSLALTHFRAAGRDWDRFQFQGAVTPQLLTADSLTIESGDLQASAAGHTDLHNWQFSTASPFVLRAQFSAVDLVKVFPGHFDNGLASGTLNVTGSPDRPTGNIHLAIENPGAYHQRARKLEADALLTPNDLQVSRGSLTALHGGHVSFEGLYARSFSWQSGRLSLHAESAGLTFSDLQIPHNVAANLTGDARFDTRLTANVENGILSPLDVSGHLALLNLASGKLKLGALNARLTTQNQALHLALQGDLRESSFHGDALVSLVSALPVHGQLRFSRLSLSTLDALVRPSQKQNLPAGGSLDGNIDFAGPLLQPALWKSTVQVDRLQADASPPGHGASIHLQNSGPILLDLSNGEANIRSFELRGQDTRLSISGSAGYLRAQPIHLAVAGSLDLRILRLLDADLQSSGHSVLQASIGGTLAAPALQGRLAFQNASFALTDFPNGLSEVNGSVAFSGNRATIENLTASSGGGLLHIAGFVNFGGANPLVYHLEAHADNVRLSYASISVTASTDLRLTGTSVSSLLSGSATISRVVFNPNTDVGSVLTNFAAPVPAPANQNLFLNGLHLDVNIESAPSLQLSTSLSHDVEAEISLRLRGTPDHPVLLGSVSANQGDIRVFGTRYSINRGEVTFVNSIKIDPVLDLDLQTQTRGITVDITLSGTLNQLNISYRSDPPLQPRDIIALLTVGRTPQEASNVQNTQVATDTTALATGANSVLGSAISAPSSRLSKLFGVTNIRLDPLVQGITNTTQSRLTLEQQISRSITVTYVTNLEQTSEQIFRFEWSINRQYSVVAVRDDNGEFGIDIQYKRRFK